MSYRIILVPMFGVHADTAALHAAFGLARRFESHVVALFAHPDPRDVIPYVGEGVSPAVIEQLTQASESEIERQRAAARTAFDNACASAGMQLAEKPPAPAPASAQWQELVGDRENLIARRGRTSDLIVFPHGNGEAVTAVQPVIEAALMDSGRPLLLVPPGLENGVGHKVAIAWNGGVEATRALAGAMPLLEAASAVHVLTSESWRTSFDVTMPLADYLEWRGITCERQPVPATNEPVAEALLRTASELEADLLVMGGYSRTRLSESLLGGVTHHVLAHARLPVLMAH